MDMVSKQLLILHKARNCSVFPSSSNCVTLLVVGNVSAEALDLSSDVYYVVLLFMDAPGGVHGNSWPLMGFHEIYGHFFPWDHHGTFMEFHGTSVKALFTSMGFHRFPWRFVAPPCALVGFDGTSTPRS